MRACLTALAVALFITTQSHADSWLTIENASAIVSDARSGASSGPKKRIDALKIASCPKANEPCAFFLFGEIADTPESNCHACGPNLYLSRLTKQSDAWGVRETWLIAKDAGSFGKAYPADLVIIGPGKTAVSIKSTYMAQGQSSSELSMWVEGEFKYQKALDIESSHHADCTEDLSRTPREQIPPSLRDGCTARDDVSYEILKTSRNGLFDLMISRATETRSPPSFKLSKKASAARFVYDGAKYQPAK